MSRSELSIIILSPAVNFIAFANNISSTCFVFLIPTRAAETEAFDSTQANEITAIKVLYLRATVFSAKFNGDDNAPKKGEGLKPESTATRSSSNPKASGAVADSKA